MRVPWRRGIFRALCVIGGLKGIVELHDITLIVEIGFHKGIQTHVVVTIVTGALFVETTSKVTQPKENDIVFVVARFVVSYRLASYTVLKQQVVIEQPGVVFRIRISITILGLARLGLPRGGSGRVVRTGVLTICHAYK